jgi:hypothetical protein
MTEESFSTKSFFDAAVTKFLEHAYINNMLEDAVSYLGFIAFAGNDQLFPISQNSDYLRNKAKNLGVINEECNISQISKKNLNDFLSNEENKFIINHKKDDDFVKIKTLFKTALESAIHEHASEFAIMQGREGAMEAAGYLAVLALSGNFKKDIVKIIPNPDIVAKLNDDARELGLTAGEGIVTQNVKNALHNFFSENNKSSKMLRESIPMLKQIFNNIKSSISQDKHIGRGKGLQI